MSASVFKMPFSGTGAITRSMTVPADHSYRLISVSCNFNLAPTTSENLTITLDDANGNPYDLLLYTLDVSAGATTDILWQPDEELMLVGGDAIDVAFVNSDARTYGLLYTVKRV
jgi:hypothetical protein